MRRAYQTLSSQQSVELQGELALGSGRLWRMRYLPRNKSARIPGPASADSSAGLGSPDRLSLLWTLWLDCPCQGQQVYLSLENQDFSMGAWWSRGVSPSGNGSDCISGTLCGSPFSSGSKTCTRPFSQGGLAARHNLWKEENGPQKW